MPPACCWIQAAKVVGPGGIFGHQAKLSVTTKPFWLAIFIKSGVLQQGLHLLQSIGAQLALSDQSHDLMARASPSKTERLKTTYHNDQQDDSLHCNHARYSFLFCCCGNN